MKVGARATLLACKPGRDREEAHGDQMKVYCNLSRKDSAWSVSLDGGGGNLEK
jgi:hypothetical protein